MSSDPVIPAAYRSDVLLLLVGGNPLPNYVSARLLAAPKAEVRLLHTRKTLHVAARLQEQLASARPDLRITPYEIDRADGAQIEAQLARQLGDVLHRARVGLNYTGGTKPMAVHSVYALRQAFPDAVFSYLDAETLSLVLQRAQEPSRLPFVGQAQHVSLETVLALHNYKAAQTGEPILPGAICRAIAQVHSTQTGLDAWRRWLTSLGDRSQAPELPDLEAYPELGPVIESFETLCEGVPTPERLAQRLNCKGNQLRSCGKALVGGWLETYVFNSLPDSELDGTTLEKHQGIRAIRQAAALSPESRDPPELDVVAMIGYQLFAVSCMVSDRRPSVKEHLLEVFVRARQLGGDEARIALVSLYPETKGLEDEVNQEWGSEAQIRVFGPQHLDRLDEYLELWIRQASRI